MAQYLHDAVRFGEQGGCAFAPTLLLCTKAQVHPGDGRFDRQAEVVECGDGLVPVGERFPPSALIEEKTAEGALDMGEVATTAALLEDLCCPAAQGQGSFSVGSEGGLDEPGACVRNRQLVVSCLS